MKKAFGIVVAMAVLAVLAPAAFGAVTLHLDAASIGQADGTPVNAWGSLTQGTASRQPLYSTTGIGGLPSVTFDGLTSGDGDALVGAGLNVAAVTIYAVVNPTAGGSLRGLVSNGSDGLNIRLDDNTTYIGPSNSQNSGDFTNDSGVLRIDDALQTPLGSGSFVLGSPHIVTAMSAGSPTYGNFMVGSPRTSGGSWTTRYWQGDIAEIIVLDNIPTRAEHNAQMSALATKYGITLASSAKPGFVIPNLLGNDLTDLGNDGVPANYNPPTTLGGFDAEFSSTDEPGFGGGEFSFNVFDNALGGTGKWCCNDPGANGHQLDAAIVNVPHYLTHFTLTSSNDSPGRDPSVFSIEGSMDGVNFDVLFSYDGLLGPLWSARNQTLLFEAGVDFTRPLLPYKVFRYNVLDTVTSSHALAEIEYFGDPTPEPCTLVLLGLGSLGLWRKRRRARA